MANREARLHQIKLRIDAVHEDVMRALKALDEEAMDRAMEEQHLLMQEYATLLKERRTAAAANIPDKPE
jgi:predicted nucleic acid-binding protein